MAKKDKIKLAEEIPTKTEITAEGMQELAATGMRKNTKQFGNSGTEIYGGQFSEEYLGELLGERAADVFDKIRRSESQVAMLLGAIYNPIKSANWEVEPFEQGNAEYEKHAKLVEHILFNTLPRGFKAHIHEALSFIPFGYSIFEVVHNVVFNDPRFGTYNGLANLGFRQQKSISRWNLEKKTGKLLSVEQQENGDVAENSTLPGEFLLVMSNNREGDNYEGISALRPMYGAWKRKHLYLKLTAIGVEKYAYGVVLGTVPSGKEKSPEFEAFAEHLRAYMSNEKSFLLRPSGWDVEIIKEAFDADKIVELLRFENTEMINALVANFLVLGTGGNGGAFALGKDLSDFFLNGIQSYAEIITDTHNMMTIPNLVQLNFGAQEGYPKLKVSGINDQAGKELADALNALAGNKFIKPDDKLEEYLRKAYKIPKADPSTARETDVPKPFGGFPQKFKEAEKVFKFAEKSDRYVKLWDQNKATVKETMQKGLRSLADKMIDAIRKKYEASSETNYIKAATNLEYSGRNEYIATLKELFAAISAEAVNEARKEVPSKKNVKLFESVETFKFGEYEKLPPFLKSLVDAISKNMETQVDDLQKIVSFQYTSSAPSTTNFEIVAKDIDEKVNAFIEGSTASGSSIDAAAGNAVANITQQSRNTFFMSDEVLPEIESFTFTNEDPISPICQDLAGTTFAADDPEAERFSPPLHHNCKSRLVPNLRGDKNNPEIDPNGLKPSRASLEKYITLSETIKLGGPGSGRKPGSGKGQKIVDKTHTPGDPLPPVETIDVGSPDGLADLTPEQVADAQKRFRAANKQGSPLETPDEQSDRAHKAEAATRERAKFNGKDPKRIAEAADKEATDALKRGEFAKYEKLSKLNRLARDYEHQKQMISILAPGAERDRWQEANDKQVIEINKRVKNLKTLD